MKNWPDPKSIRDIQVLLGCASFYQRFIQRLNKLAGLLTLMLRTTPTQSAKKLPLSMNGAEDAKVGSGTSFTIKSAENLTESVNMAEDAEVGESNGGDDKTIEKSPLSKKPNGPMGYFISLHSERK